MYRLKQFGDSVLNWLKVPKRKRISLKKTLFLQPLGVLLGIFALILVLFHLGLSYFIREQVNEAVQDRFDTMDARYVGKVVEEQEGENLFSTTYVIVNGQHETVYVSASQDELNSSAISDHVVQYFYDHDDDWEFFDDEDEDEEEENEELESSKRGAAPVFVQLENNRYAVKIREYQGRLEQYFIQQDVSSQETYYVLVFVNTTPLEEFSSRINWILLGLMLVFGSIASLFLLWTNRRIDQDFRQIKEEIESVGQGKAYQGTRKLVFEELYETQTAVQQMQDLLAANERSQQLFFQNASHELRTPLMSIQGYAEGIETGVLKDIPASARIIQTETQKMKQLVDDILHLSRLEEVQIELEREEISLADFLRDVAWPFQVQADQMELVLEHQFAHQTLTLRLDEVLMERALKNLLGNALRYAQKRIRISTKEDADCISIEIANDGIPIEEKDLPHLFDRFYKSQGGHFGIGLAITKEIVERHGGSIGVISQESETSFWIQLPKHQ